jgi:hypothetical protein
MAPERAREKEDSMGPMRRQYLLVASSLLAAVAIAAAAWTVYAASAAERAHSAHALLQTTPADWEPIERVMGKAGTMEADGVLRFSFPRSDLQVTARGVAIRPALALGSWVAFKRMGDGAMVMGDLVLSEDEVNPVLWALRQGGIEQTALHNHLAGESPRIMYLHIGGHGDAEHMAETIHAALAQSATPLTAPATSTQPELDLDTAQLDRIVGHTGTANGGVYQFSIPRAERIRDVGMEVPPAMGTGTAINFQPTGGGAAAVTGDFVLLAREVNPVIRALREHGIEITALHSHMLTEEPRLFFMHFWAHDDAVRLARALRDALARTNSVATTAE